MTDTSHPSSALEDAGSADPAASPPRTELNRVAPAKRPPRRSRYAVALRTPKAIAGLSLLAVIVIAGLAGPLVVGISPYAQGPDALAQPTAAHLLGTDEVGRDILARVLAGIRVDLLICLVAVPIAAVVGTLLGLIGGLSAFLGEAFQRVFDVLLGFPGIILGIAVTLAVGPGFLAIVLAIVFTTIPLFGRQSRAALLAQLSRDYVTAATVVGVPRWQIIGRHVLPNVVDSVITLVAVVMASAIKIEGGLSVVGLGIQPPESSLGAMISSGSKYVFQSPLYALVPVLLLAALVYSLTLISDALNRAGLRS